MSTNQLAVLILSAIIVLGFGGVVVAWIIWPPEGRNDILIALSATLGTGYLQVINYWFRSKESDK